MQRPQNCTRVAGSRALKVCAEEVNGGRVEGQQMEMGACSGFNQFRRNGPSSLWPVEQEGYIKRGCLSTPAHIMLSQYDWPELLCIS